MDLHDIIVPDHVDIVASERENTSPIFDIVKDTIRFANGDSADRQYMDHHNAVGIVALRPRTHDAPRGLSDWEMLLIRQYRHPVRALLWEIPAGLCDQAGEPELDAARRELREETDYDAHQWQRTVNFITSPGVSNEYLTIFLAFDVVEHSETDFVREAEESEIITRWWNLTDVVDAVLAGNLSSPTLVSGALTAAITLARRGEDSH